MLTIGPAMIEDLEEILALQKAAYISQARIYNDYNIPPLLQTLDETFQEAKRSVILKAVEDNRIVGSVRGYAVDGTCYIGKLMVQESYRRQGLGRNLIKAIEDSFPGCRYELFTGHLSEHNIYLYESLGYKRFKEVPIYEGMIYIYMEKVQGGHL